MEKAYTILSILLVLAGALLFISSTKSHLPNTWIYSAGSAPSCNAIERKFVGTATTDANGVATFYATTDGTASGSALFNNIMTVHATTRNNTASAIAVPIASVKEISSGKTITVNVVTGRNLLALGATTAFAGAGITVDLVILGN